MPQVALDPPRPTGAGTTETDTSTRYYLELTGKSFDGDWFRGGPHMMDGYATEAEAWAEWDACDVRYRYTGHRVVQEHWTCTVTVLDEHR